MNASPGDFSVSEPAGNTDFKLHIARDRHAFEALKQHWTDLERVATAKAPFQSFQWCRNAIEHKRTDGDPNLFVCCVFVSDVLVGLLPLAYWKKGRRLVLTGLAEPFQLHTEMLAAPEYSPAALFRMMHGEILRSGADYLHLGQVRRFGPLHHAVQGLVPATGKPEAEPFAQLPDWRSCEDLGKTMDGLQEPGTEDQRQKGLNAIRQHDPAALDCSTRGTSGDRADAAGGPLVQDHVLALSPLGRLYCGAWLGFVRPLAKRLLRAA